MATSIFDKLVALRLKEGEEDAEFWTALGLGVGRGMMSEERREKLPTPQFSDPLAASMFGTMSGLGTTGKRLTGEYLSRDMADDWEKQSVAAMTAYITDEEAPIPRTEWYSPSLDRTVTEKPESKRDFMRDFESKTQNFERRMRTFNRENPNASPLEVAQAQFIASQGAGLRIEDLQKYATYRKTLTPTPVKKGKGIELKSGDIKRWSEGLLKLNEIEPDSKDAELIKLNFEAAARQLAVYLGESEKLKRGDIEGAMIKAITNKDIISEEGGFLGFWEDDKFNESAFKNAVINNVLKRAGINPEEVNKKPENPTEGESWTHPVTKAKWVALKRDTGEVTWIDVEQAKRSSGKVEEQKQTSPVYQTPSVYEPNVSSNVDSIETLLKEPNGEAIYTQLVKMAKEFVTARDSGDRTKANRIYDRMKSDKYFNIKPSLGNLSAGVDIPEGKIIDQIIKNEIYLKETEGSLDNEALNKATSVGEKSVAMNTESYDKLASAFNATPELYHSTEEVSDAELSFQKEKKWDLNKIYTAIADAEFRNTTPEFIRTKHAPKEGSSAYGPAQVTGPTMRDALKLKLSKSEKEYVERFLKQSEKFLKYGNSPHKEGYEKKYDYGGKGDLTSSKDKVLYKQVVKKLITKKLKEAKGDINKFLDIWRYGKKGAETQEAEQLDPEYSSVFLTNVSPSTLSLTTNVSPSTRPLTTQDEEFLEQILRR